MGRLNTSFKGLVFTGVIGSAALLIESRLSVSTDVHFLLEFLWLGVIAAALLVFALLAVSPATIHSTSSTIPDVPEWYDEDRLFLQQHPDTNADWSNEQEGQL